MTFLDAVGCAGFIWVISVIVLIAVIYKLQIEPMMKRRKRG